MPAKKPAKTQKQSSKPAAGKAALVKKKTVVVSKPKASAKPLPSLLAKPAAKPVARPRETRQAGQAKSEPKLKTSTKPVRRQGRSGCKAAPTKVLPPAVVKVVKAPANPLRLPTCCGEAGATAAPAKPSKPGTHPAAAPAAKPATNPLQPQGCRTINPADPIRSAVAVKSSVPVVKPKKDSAASANNPDAEDIDLESLSLLAGPRNVKPYQIRRDEEYMNAAQLEHFRTILQSWKKDLMTEVDRTVLHMKDEAANFPDPNDRATQESEFSLELRTRDRERKLIGKIEEALNRMRMAATATAPRPVRKSASSGEARPVARCP
jgi:DnaK suppressor protein